MPPAAPTAPGAPAAPPVPAGPVAPAAGRGAASHGSLLQLIRDRGTLTRQELLAATGISRSTLVQRLGDLEALGLVHESGQRSSTGGRPAKRLRFDDRTKVALTLDVGQTHATLALCTLRAEPLASTLVAIERGRSTAALLDGLARLAVPVLAEHADRELVGVGLGVPAPVRSPAGDRWPTQALPDADHPIAADLGERFGVPVVVENDARAMALGDHRETEGVFLTIKYASGLGAGVISDGHVLRGSTGAAGDIGHMRISDDGPVCTCGLAGCLAAYTSGRALLESVADRGVTTLPGLLALVDGGDAAATRLVTGAADRVGTHLAGLVQSLNPTRVAFGGTLGLHPLVREHVVAAIRARTLPRVGELTQFVASPLGPLAGTVGLVRLVTETVYAPARVDDLIEERCRTAG